VQRGNLEAFRVGRAVLVPRDAVDKWIHGETRTQRVAA
jgi:excisionase family DNA binding protein